MKKKFYSNGKLLITGEYVVLDGARAFALPTKYGQNLLVEKGENNQISWKSFDADGSIWYEDVIDFESIITNKDTNTSNSIRSTLIEILHEAHRLNPKFILESNGYEVITQLTFPRTWGLGTSSTLINNIAQWLEIDAYTLLQNSFGGSGYDLACAQHDTPIIYQLINEIPTVEKVDFSPEFTNKIYFVHLNKKQSSKSAIAKYYGKKNSIDRKIEIISQLTHTVVQSTDPKTFALALQKHELEMSAVLESQIVQELLFSDFKGVIKSLGAWGGDFVLAISKENPSNYFKNKGFETVIPYSEMILQ
jgi:mevalonate kinase